MGFGQGFRELIDFDDFAQSSNRWMEFLCSTAAKVAAVGPTSAMVCCAESTPQTRCLRQSLDCMLVLMSRMAIS